MSQAERLAHISQALSDGRGITSQQIQKHFQISRATAMRDIEYLRDRLNVPIEYDASTHAYKLPEAQDEGHRRQLVPGMWLSPYQAYSLLTLYNLVRQFDPGVLDPYLRPLGPLVKDFLIKTGFPMRGFDSKVKVDIPWGQRPGQIPFSELSYSVANDEPIYVEGIDTEGENFSGEYVVTQMTLRLDGWWIGLSRDSGNEKKQAQVAKLRVVRYCARGDPTNI